MELKVWVEGIQRIVCGVTENTTCQDVVFALAHATRRTGRFTLTERWRNNERFLAPYEHPLKVLFKWGEYSNDVQFILQHSSSNSNDQSLQSVTPPIVSNNHSLRTPSPDTKETSVIRKSSTAPPTSLSSSVHSRAENVGIVKGIPKQIPPPSSSPPPVKAEERLAETHKSPVKLNDTDSSLQYRGTIYSQHNNGIRKTIPPSYRDPPEPSIPYIRALPPYRDPPPPTVQNAKNDEYRQDSELKDNSARTVQYHDLIRLLAYQRDKLSSQQAELTKYDAEIMYWETKTKEQQHQMEILAKDATRVDATLKQVDEQLRSVGAIEEEMELVKQQDRTLKSELTLLRSKLANCETELLLCKNKIRLLLDEIRIEQRILAREADEKNHIERSTLAEVDRLQLQVEQAKYDTEMAAQIGDTLNKEVAVLEATINEKKRLVEKLVSDMKEANLESLAISPPEELKMIAEGAPFSKSGSTRRMIGSPRQLENAVPTSKNPHGVWV